MKITYEKVIYILIALVVFKLNAQENKTERVSDILINKNVKYNIAVTYNAPGFTKAKLIWENVTIRFPEEGEKFQVLIVDDFMMSAINEVYEKFYKNTYSTLDNNHIFRLFEWQ